MPNIVTLPVLENPSPKLQRQLVLVAKVIQNVANMSKVTKESFMDELAVFRDKNIPKIKGFYDQILVSSLLLQKFFYCALKLTFFAHEGCAKNGTSSTEQ